MMSKQQGKEKTEINVSKWVFPNGCSPFGATGATVFLPETITDALHAYGQYHTLR